MFWGSLFRVWWASALSNDTGREFTLLHRQFTARQAARITGSPLTPLRRRWATICVSPTALGEVALIMGLIGLWLSFTFQAVFLDPIADVSAVLHVNYPGTWAMLSASIAGLHIYGLLMWRHWARVFATYLATVFISV